MEQINVDTPLPPTPNAIPAVPTDPGWYPDPASVDHLRWWDGREWLDETKPPGGPSASAVTLVANPGEDPSRERLSAGTAHLEPDVFTCEPPAKAIAKGLVTATVIQPLHAPISRQTADAGTPGRSDDERRSNTAVAEAVTELRTQAKAYDANQIYALRVSAAPVGDELCVVVTGTAVSTA